MKIRLAQEKAAHGVHFKVEESKLVKARLDLAYDELQELVSTNAAEREQIEHAHAKQIQILTLEKQAAVIAYGEQIESLILTRQSSRTEAEELRENVAVAAAAVLKLKVIKVLQARLIRLLRFSFFLSSQARLCFFLSLFLLE